MSRTCAVTLTLGLGQSVARAILERGAKRYAQDQIPDLPWAQLLLRPGGRQQFGQACAVEEASSASLGTSSKRHVLPW